MIKILFSVFATLILSSQCLLAQEYSISGSVKDSTGTGLPDVIVTLLYASDSSSAGFEMTRENGTFGFKSVSGGAYILAINSLGYASFTYPVAVHDNISSLDLVLLRNASQLAVVTVTSKRPYIETGLGKTLINVGASTVSAGSNVLELLRKTPGVQLQESNITLQGVGVMVLVDDKQTYLSGQELADYLAGLSADVVAQIELISQPSSKYDAEGGGGIINIETRKPNKKGFNGNVSLAAGQTVYSNTHNALNLSYQRNKLRLHANAAQLYATGSLARTVDQTVKDATTGELLNESRTRSVQKETFADYSLRIGGDYALSDKATVGASAKGIYHPNDEHDETYTDITDNAGVLSLNETGSNLGFLRNHYICNAYLKFSPGKASSLTLDGDYLYRDQNGYLDLASSNYSDQRQPVMICI